MIGVMDRPMEDASPEKEEAALPKHKKPEVKTPTITSFFKPPIKSTPPTQESKPSDLRNYFQVKKTDEEDLPKVCAAAPAPKKDPKKGEKTTDLYDNCNGHLTKNNAKKETGKQDGKRKSENKKPKRQKRDSKPEKDDDADPDFESPPPVRRKRKSRLDSDSIKDFIDAEDTHQGLSENGSKGTCTGEKVEVPEPDGEKVVDDEEDAMNTSTIVSYEDFLKNSFGDEDEGEYDIEDDIKLETPNGDVEVKNDCVVNSDHPPDSVMLTPPDSRCSQESPKRDQTATPPSKEDTKKEEVVNNTDTCQRKVITIKAQVHSPLDGRDRDSSPSTSPVVHAEMSSRKGLSPRRLISNVSVLDSSPELSLISVETKEEPKKTGPVYSIFQPKPILKKGLTKKDLSAVKKKESSEDSCKNEAKDSNAGEKEKKALKKQEERDKAASANDVQDNKAAEEDKESKEKQGEKTEKSELVNQKGQKEKKVVIQQCLFPGKDKASTTKNVSSVATEKGNASQKSSSKAPKSGNKKSSKRKKDERESEDEASVPPTRVLRARVPKTSTSAESSMDEFDDVKPLKPKTSKQSRKDAAKSKKSSGKPGVKAKKKALEKSKTTQKFKSSLVTEDKGRGPIKLKLTAIKSSPKKNNKVTKAQQLLQKAKKGHQTTFISMATKQPLKKNTAQSTLPQAKTKLISLKVEKSKPSEKTKLVVKQTQSTKPRGKTQKVDDASKKKTGKMEKTGGDGAQKQTPRRRSSSRNKPKTPPKPAAKLAPIFTKQGQLAAAKKFKQDSIMAAMSDPLALDEASRDSLIDSKETTGDGGPAGLGFNMLEQLKNEPGLPQKEPDSQLHRACHITQRDETDPFWKLQSSSLGKWKLGCDLHPEIKINGRLKLATTVIPSASGTSNFKLFTGHAPLSDAVQKAVMDEVLKANPKFPVQKIFRMYQAKKNGETQKKEDGKLDKQSSDKTQGTNPNSSDIATSGKASKLSRGKRKADDANNEENNTRRKMARRSGRRSLEASLDNASTEGAGEEEPNLRRSSRRSSKRLTQIEGTEDENKKREGKMVEKKEEEKDGKVHGVVEESQEEKRRAGMLWTEKYQPAAVTEMIGNTALFRKFSTWLTEWKKKTQRMKEKTKDKKASKGSRRIDSDDDSDDDFCCSDFDDSDEEDGLCNTILLSGPHGMGKTSLVHACAQELGFEVFEVNASSRRNGRQILSELGEGTQSHQVARQPGLSNAHFFSSQNKSGPAKPPSPKKKKPVLPKAFAGFIKAGSSASLSSKRSPVKKQSAKKSPKKAVKESPTKKPPSSQLPGSQSKPKLTSTSLILFDEVDIIFEEDKGFLSTVMSFMESSKRPIVLTTSDPRFSFSLTARYDELTLKPPQLNQLVSHLKLLCLAENVPISHQDLKIISEFFNRDIRRCLHHLQFWVCSGALPRRDAIQGTVDKTELDTGASGDTRVSQSADGGMDTDDDGPVRWAMEDLIQELIYVETKIIAVGEYYSMMGHKPQDVVKILDGMGLTDHEKTVKDLCNGTNSIQDLVGRSCKTDVWIYCGLFESVAGIGNIAGPVINSFNLLKWLDNPIQLAAILKSFHDLGIDAAHCNLPQILSPLSNTKDLTSNKSMSNQESASKSSDDDEFTDDEKKRRSKLSGHLMDIMAEHTDRMSEMDTMLTHNQRQDAHLRRYGNNEWWHPLVLPTLLDKEGWIGDDYELADVRHYDARGETNILDMNHYLEAMGLRDCMRRCTRTVNKLSRESNTRWDKVMHDVFPSVEDHLEIQSSKLDTTLRETNCSVIRRLPDSVHNHHSALALDYLPTLRGICRFEELRRETNLKRRFFHYLDSIAFCLKPVTHLSLASILKPNQGP